MTGSVQRAILRQIDRKKTYNTHIVENEVGVILRFVYIFTPEHRSRKDYRSYRCRLHGLHWLPDLVIRSQGRSSWDGHIKRSGSARANGDSGKGFQRDSPLDHVDVNR